MNKTLKVLISASLCLALCASFFACKNGGEEVGGNPVPSVDESTDENDVGVLTEDGSSSWKEKDSNVEEREADNLSAGENVIGEETVPLDFDFEVQYIRTDGYHDGAVFPRTVKISSVEELNAYYEANKEMYDFSHKEKVYSDTTVGFVDAIEKYDEAFFEESFLLFALLEEGSGSVRHEVKGLERDPDDGSILVVVDRFVPECCTDDMAEWHIILELPKNLAESEFKAE